jgi:hypothetical protein
MMNGQFEQFFLEKDRNGEVCEMRWDRLEYYVMLCYVVRCYVMLCDMMVCDMILGYVVLCDMLLCDMKFLLCDMNERDDVWWNVVCVKTCDIFYKVM